MKTQSMPFLMTWSGSPLRWQRLTGALALLAVTLCCTSGSEAAESTAPPAESEDEISEIVVRAPEPRYVAPTNRDRIGRVWVPVKINGRGPYRLVLDSGATRSAVVGRVAEELNMRLDESPPVMLRGVTGSAVTPTIKIQSLSFGDLEIGESSLPVVIDAFGGADGLLGLQGMEDKRIYIDFKNDFINIARSRNRRAAEGFTTLSFLGNNNRILIVPAQVGNMRVRAIIDTGAQTTIGNDALKTALERRINSQRRTRDEITGATGARQTGIGAEVSPIRLGSVLVRDAHVTFGEMHIFRHWGLGDEPALMIGMDILGLLDTLVIDYLRQEVHVKPRSNS